MGALQKGAGASRGFQALGQRPLEEPQILGGAGFRVLPLRGKQCTLYRIGPPGVAVGRAVPPMNGRARRGSIRPFSIGSSHCLTQCGCSSCRTSSVSDHLSNGWEQRKQAGWEFRV